MEAIRALAGPSVRGFPALGGYLERGRSLVLRGGIPMENTAPPYDFTWAFVLEDGVSCHGHQAGKRHQDDR